MYGNDLISQFGKKEKKQGYLNLDKLDYHILNSPKWHKATFVEINGKKYYIKHQENNNDRASAEIINGILFNKAGIVSAEYLPIEFENKKCVISNDVLNQNCMSLCDYEISLIDKKNIYFKPFLFAKDKRYENFDRLSLATLDCLRQSLIINAIDLGINNWDGTCNNRGVQVVNGIATAMRVFDNEASGWGWNENISEFTNSFVAHRISHEEIINHYRTNEEYRKYITPQELAEVVGSLPLDESAKEFTEQTGYQFSQEYLDFLKFNTDKTAEELEHC